MRSLTFSSICLSRDIANALKMAPITEGPSSLWVGGFGDSVVFVLSVAVERGTSVLCSCVSSSSISPLDAEAAFFCSVGSLDCVALARIVALPPAYFSCSTADAYVIPDRSVPFQRRHFLKVPSNQEYVLPSKCCSVPFPVKIPRLNVPLNVTLCVFLPRLEFVQRTARPYPSARPFLQSPV